MKITGAESKWRSNSGSLWWKIPMYLLFFVLALLTIGTTDFAGLRVLWHLLAGWAYYLVRTLPQIQWNAEAIFSAFLLLALFLGGTHLLAGKLAQTAGSRWRFRWAVAAVLACVMVFGSALAAGGLSHQVVWLKRTEWLIESPGRISRNISNVRQLITGIRLFASDDEGRYPRELEELVTEEIMEAESLARMRWTRVVPGETPEPWVYVRGMNDQMDGGLPVIFSPRLHKGGGAVVGLNDSSVSWMKAKDIREALPRWREGYRAAKVEFPFSLEELGKE